MSTEHSIFVRIPDALAEDILQLNERAVACLSRSAKLPPGDRTEVIRFENLHSTIDQIALAVLSASDTQVAYVKDGISLESSSQRAGTSLLGPEDVGDKNLPKPVVNWLREGGIAVELFLPHGRGETTVENSGRSQPVGPAKRWQSKARNPREAVKERFEHSMMTALADDGADTFISPSGVSNRVLTDTLHRYSQVGSGQPRRDVPVVYRDGSNGPDFPLRALKMRDEQLERARVMKFSLLSIRHVGMDAIIDGAWLRNARVSRVRQAGLTDQIVFEISQKQLLSFDPKVPTVIEMYQTGLEPAIMGFYRAVIFHLLKYPGSISVQPQFFAGGRDFEPGLVWSA